MGENKIFKPQLKLEMEKEQNGSLNKHIEGNLYLGS